MKKLILLLLPVCLLSSCSPKTLNGVYRSYAEPGILMAGYTYDFHGDGTFDMKFWSDDISSNRLGRGNYTVEKRKLLLDFEKVDPISSRYVVRKLSDDGSALSKLKFSIGDHKESKIVGVNILIHDTSGELVAHGVTDKTGFCNILVPRTDIEKSIQIAYVGMDGLEIPLPDSSPKAFEIVLVGKTGYVEPGEQRVYRFKKTDDFLKLKDEERTITLKRESP